MLGTNKWNSIRWRIVLIYFLLVFIAMTIVSVFIVNQLKVYQFNSIRDDLTKTVKDSGLLSSFEEYDDLGSYAEEIQKSLDQGWKKSFQEEMSIIDTDFMIIASTNNNIIGKNAAELLNTTILTTAIIGGEQAEADGINSANIPIKNITFPIGKEGDITGTVYIRADLSSVFDFLTQSKLIFIRAMVLALFVTVVLGFFIAKSITVPINDVTEKAEKMAEGDFSQEVSVKSDDEIGRLAEMFNLLRKKLEFTLAEISNEKSKLETILRYMADGLIAIDLSGRIIHANPAAMQMLGLSDSELQTNNCDEILEKYSNIFHLENLKKNCKEGSGQEIFSYGASSFAVRYDRFRDDNDEDVGIIMILQDVTERQKLENMQTDFVANVSHELKTPLTTIKSYTETLMDCTVEDADMARNFLKIIDTEADRMNRLVKELLQLSRLDYKQEKWHKKDSNIIWLLRSVVTKVEMTAKQKKQHLNCIFDDEQKLMVTIDKDRVEQVILNILSNAIKYTQEGGRIDIDVLMVDGQARIIVTDNGIGMSELEIPRIFERFYRVDKARSRAMGGTGLGLSISKQIVEEHGGTIEIESEEAKGTKATIILPLAPIRGQSNIE